MWPILCHRKKMVSFFGNFETSRWMVDICIVTHSTSTMAPNSIIIHPFLLKQIKFAYCETDSSYRFLTQSSTLWIDARFVPELAMEAQSDVINAITIAKTKYSAMAKRDEQKLHPINLQVGNEKSLVCWQICGLFESGQMSPTIRSGIVWRSRIEALIPIK